jgi:hypothetical protein
LPRVSAWYLVVAGIAVLYAVIGRVGYQELASITGLAANGWDQVFVVVCDPYLLCYLVLPLWLIRQATISGYQVLPQVLQRCGSRFRWLARAYRVALADATGFAGSLLAVGLATGVGLPWETGWSQLTSAAEHGGLTFHALSLLGLPPLAMAGAQVVFLTVGLAGFAVVQSALRLANPANTYQYMAAAALWLTTIITFRMPTGFPPLNLFDTLLLGSAVTDYGSLAAWIAVSWMPAVVFGCQAASRWIAKTNLPQARYLVLGCTAVGVTLLSVATSTGRDTQAALFEAFHGGAHGQTRLSTYLVLAVISLIPVWLFAANLNDILDGPIHSQLIRSRSLTTWWAARLGKCSLLTAGYLTAVLALLLGLFSVGMGQRSDGFPAPPLAIMGYHWVVNGTLQIVFYLLTLFLARWLAANEAATLVAAGAIVAFGFPLLNPNAWWPLMLNALGYTEHGWTASLQITAQLALSDLVVGAATIIILTRLGRVNERNI